MSDFRIIETSIISELKEVRLYDETIQHICKEHPEVPINLPSIVIGVEQAVANPTHVEKSYESSYVFVDESSTNSTGDPLRVPVKVIGERSGRIRTAFFASTSGPKEIVWRRSDG